MNQPSPPFNPFEKLKAKIPEKPETQTGVPTEFPKANPVANPTNPSFPAFPTSWIRTSEQSKQPWKPDLANLAKPSTTHINPLGRFGKLRAVRPGPSESLPKDWPKPTAGPEPDPNSNWGKNPILSISQCLHIKNRWVVKLTPKAIENIAIPMGWKPDQAGGYSILDPSHLLLLAPFLGKIQRKRLGLVDQRITPPEECGGIPVIFRLRLINNNLNMLHQRFPLPNWYRNKFAFFAVFAKNPVLNKVFGQAGWNYIPAIRAWATPSLSVAASMAAYADEPLAKIFDQQGCPSLLHRFLRFSPSVYPLNEKYHLAMANSGKHQLSEPHAIWKGLPPHPGWRTTSGTALQHYIQYIPRPMANAVLQLIHSGSLQDLDIGKSYLELESGGNSTILGPVSPGKKVPQIKVCSVPGCKKPYANHLVKLQNQHKCKNCTKRCMTWSEVLTQQRYTTKEAWRGMIENLAPLSLQNLQDQDFLPIDLTDEKLDKLLPTGESYFAHQYDAIRHCCHWKISLQGDIMGAGKTLIALKTIQITTEKKTHPRILVIVPANLTLKWHQDAIRWNPNRKPRILKSRDVPTQGEISIISYDSARNSKHIQNINWDFVVCDESHSIKNMAAKRTKAILNLNAERWMFVTATPLYNRPRDVFPYFHKANPQIFASPEKFMKSFPLEQPNHPTDFENQGLDLLATLLRNSIMIRRPKQILLKNMPEERPPEIIPVEISGQNVKKIKIIEQELLDRYKRIKATGGRDPVALAQMTALRVNIGEYKLPAVKDFIDSVARAGEPFLIFTWQRPIAKELLQHATQAGLKAGLLSGDLNPHERFKTGEKFQKGLLDCVIGTIDASGVGLDLFRAGIVVFAELDWTPAKINQARGRAWRPGQTQSMRTIYFTVQDSGIDSHIASTLAGKNRSSDRGLGDNDPTPQSIMEILRLQEEILKAQENSQENNES